jgi:hypothetical protein
MRPCQCRIETPWAADAALIVFCPLHAQAPALREALAAWLRLFDELTFVWGEGDAMRVYTAVAQARAVLKACEP